MISKKTNFNYTHGSTTVVEVVVLDKSRKSDNSSSNSSGALGEGAPSLWICSAATSRKARISSPERNEV